MEVSRVRALRGPNLWSSLTAIQAVVSCGEVEVIPAGVSEFLGFFQKRFPQITLLQPAFRHDIATMAHALERATLALQMAAGCPVTFSKTIETLEEGVYQIVVEYSDEAVGRLAMELAEMLCRNATENAVIDPSDAVNRLRELNDDIRLGPSTNAIVSAAVARGIPFRRLTDGSMVQLGWGSRQRRILAAETDLTGAVAEAIAQD